MSNKITLSIILHKRTSNCNKKSDGLSNNILILCMSPGYAIKIFVSELSGCTNLVNDTLETYVQYDNHTVAVEHLIYGQSKSRF